jgi:hypothetical protein
MRLRVLFGSFLVLALGCGGPKIATVKGKVTLNGKPLANALVTFQPIAPGGSIDAGPGSAAKTNAQGEFTLKAMTGASGAVVGEHRVLISVLTVGDTSGDERPVRGGPPLEETIPERYNKESVLKFTVKPGPNEANFDLTSP